jgi:hypothetical protein
MTGCCMRYAAGEKSAKHRPSIAIVQMETSAAAAASISAEGPARSSRETSAPTAGVAIFAGKPPVEAQCAGRPVAEAVVEAREAVTRTARTRTGTLSGVCADDRFQRKEVLAVPRP